MWLQNLACSYYGWRQGRVRYGGGFQRALTAVRERASWDDARITKFRDARLRAFIAHCAATVPFYQEQFKQVGLTPADIRGLADLSCLPILTKDTVQTRGDAFLSTAVPPHERRIACTSGTTGTGLRFATTQAAVQEQWAVWWRYRQNHGLSLGTWCGLFTGRPVVPPDQCRPPFWRINWPGHQVVFSGYHMSPANLPHYVAALRRYRLPWLHGYPSLLTVLAEYLSNNGGLGDYAPRWVTTGAENLLPHQIELMTAIFGVQPRQHYGLEEAVANLSECEAGRLHVDEDFAAVEFVWDPTVNGFRIIGTNLSNTATPLLRYDTGDIATISQDPCTCGRPGRVVDRIDGRQEDYVALEDGTRIGRLDHLLKGMLGIREAQIRQRERRAITLRLVVGPRFSPSDERELLRRARARLGARVAISVEYVDRIERTARGKLRFVVSELPEESIVR